MPVVETPYPKENWLETSLVYEGMGHLELEDPYIIIKGKANIQFDGLGEASAWIECDDISFTSPTDPDLIQLFKKNPLSVPEFAKLKPIINQITNNTLKKFTAKTSKGVFSLTDDKIIYSYDKINNRINVSFLNSAFTSSKRTQIKYMVLPISNFLPAEFDNSDSKFRDHPLRTGHGDNLIYFYINEAPCFIEPLSTYEDRRKELLEGKSNREITAVIICELVTPQIEILDIEHLLDLLSLATGSEIGVPWIECRDDQGELIKRIHLQLNQWSNFSRGHVVIDEWIHNGIGRLIASYWSSSYKNSPDLTAIARNLVKSGFNDLTTEDRLSYLFRALDCLCIAYGLGKIDLRQKLDIDQTRAVNEAFDSFAYKIHFLSREAAGKARTAAKKGLSDESKKFEERHNILQGMESSINMNPPYMDDRYGRKVAQLLSDFELYDVSIVNSFYRENRRPDKKKSLIGILSYYRGVTMHKGYFDFQKDLYLRKDIPRVRSHLHDILLRIVLKMLCYDGNYQSPISYLPVPVDWVKPTTSARELGYTNS
jgi:hypothetical protein